MSISEVVTPGVARPESLFAFQFPSDPQVSPDGTRVAFVLTRIAESGEKPTDDADFPRPRYHSRLQLSDGGPARDLTFGKGGEGRDSAPLWSPDGQSLAFLSDRAGKNQLFLLPLGGGEASQLTSSANGFKGGVSSAAFSPDGRYLSFLSQGDTKDRRDERGEARAVTSVRYRFNGRGMLPPEPASLYLHDLQSGETAVWYAAPFDLADYVWRPDSGGVLFVSSASEEDAVSWRQEVFELQVGAAQPGETRPREAQPRQLTRWAAPIGNLAVHPDGVRFAGIGRPPGKVNTEDQHVFLFGEDGQGVRLDSAWDCPAGNIVSGDLHVGSFPDRPVWKDASTLSLLYTVGGSVGLFDLNLEGVVTPRVHDAERVVTGFTAAGNHLAHVSESAAEPTEVYLDGVKVTDCAASLPFTPAVPTRVGFQTELGEGEGWVLLPPGGESVPALLNIHGGPHTAYGHGFMHEFQLFAQAGYGVCYSNPRGSVGYGQAWSEDIAGRWGSVDMADLLAFFDAALTAEPRLDASRTGIMGGSYGGFMTNWITSQTTRFQVAVTDRSICNLISFGGTSDIGMRFWDDELGGNFHRSADVDKLWAMSPLKYVENVATPTLIVHSLEDLRCPVEQGEQWFAALQLHGVPSRFVRFPEETHELSRSGRPDRRARRLQEYLDWLGQYLKA